MRISLAGAGTLMLLALGASAEPAPADDAGDARRLFGDITDRELRYEFRVEGDRVGIGEGRIRKIGPARWQVDIAYEIDVDVLGVDLYDLDLEARETYRGARLVALESDSSEDGERHEISGAADGDVFRYTHNGAVAEVAADIVPSTQLWRKRLLERTRVLHVIEGEPFDRTPRPIEDRTVENPDGGEMVLEGVHIETPHETADLWYDREGLLQRAVVERMGVTMVIRRMLEGES